METNELHRGRLIDHLQLVVRDLPASQRLKVISLVSEQPAGCILRNDPSLPTQRILRTLVRMRVSGEIQQIIDRYTAPRI